MAINFDSALGIHPQALTLRERRGEILAANMANADTPDYKARDLDFKTALQRAVDSSSSSSPNPLRTDNRHLPGLNALLGGQLMYRNPMQASLDGNTVESQIEEAKYAQNAVQYQASLQFLKDEFAGLRTALRGD